MESSHDLGTRLDEKEYEKQDLMKTVSEKEQLILNLRYEIDKARVEIRKHDIELVQAKFLLRKLDTEIKIITRAFWNAKNSGL